MDRPRRPLHSHDDYIYTSDTGREYVKFIGAIFGILLISLLLTFGRGWDVKYLMLDFTALFLIISSAYKIFRLEVFSKIYQSFDVIAVRWPAWGFIFPFVELAIGADYLFSNGSGVLYVLTIIVMGINIYSFIQRPNNQSHVQYACLDTNLRLPVATMSFVEGILILIVTIIVFVFLQS